MAPTTLQCLSSRIFPIAISFQQSPGSSFCAQRRLGAKSIRILKHNGLFLTKTSTRSNRTANPSCVVILMGKLV